MIDIVRRTEPPKAVRLAYEQAKAYLARRHPFYASVLLSIPTIWTEHISGCVYGATDGKNLILNPDGCKDLKFRQWCFLLIHEAWHICHLHPFRLKHREHLIWNIAADYVINNHILQEHDFQAIPGILYDKQYKDDSPEQVYEKIYDEVKEKIEKGTNGGQGQPGTSAGQQSIGSDPGANMGKDPNEAKDKASKGSDPGSQKEEDLGGTGTGTEAGNIPRSIQIDWLHGDIIDPRITMDDIERQKAESEARQIVHRAALHAQAFGSDTRIAQAFIEDIKPKQPWQQAIQTFVTDLMTMDDYTWKRPRQRYLPQNIYLPSLGGTKDPKLIAIAVDVSGSISKSMLKEFLEELTSLIHNHPRITYHIYYVDTEIQLEHEITIDNLPIEEQAISGGGTCFRPAFDKIAEEGLPVSGLIYFTDMGAYDYGAEPDYPVIWLNFSHPYDEDDYHEDSYDRVPWGTVVNMQGSNTC